MLMKIGYTWPVVVAIGIVAPLSAQEKGASVDRFEPLSHEAAWQVLAPAQPALPTWARTLIRGRPRTTVAMLKLDHLHRNQNPLGPALAARLRWTVADALQCDYYRQTSARDLLAAGIRQRDRRGCACLTEQSRIGRVRHEKIVL